MLQARQVIGRELLLWLLIVVTIALLVGIAWLLLVREPPHRSVPVKPLIITTGTYEPAL